MRVATRHLSAARQQQVFVVTTPANHLFGVHRLTREGHSQSCVFGFLERQQADLIARSLESYHLQHGTFPPRDLAAERVALVDSLRPSDLALRDLRVQPLALPDLLYRLRGTGIVVTLLSLDTANGSSKTVAFRCQDVYTDTSASSVLGTLDRAWSRTECDVRREDALPGLLPKPRRPVGVEGKLLAAWLIKFMVFVEAASAVWLLPSLFF